MGTQSAYPLDADEPSLEEAIQADLTRLRAINMRFAERLDAMAETELRPERLAQLNTASVKTARAVRQIAVLQLEIAGKRPLPNVRAPAAAANANKPEAAKPYRNGPRPSPRPWKHGDYKDYDDYTDDERRICLDTIAEEAIEKLRAAQDEDFRAAGRERPCGQSFVTKLDLIHGIPHPAFDQCLKGIHPDIALLLLGPDRLNLVLAPGSADALAKFDADQEWIESLKRRNTS
jgi:hypothetical protein